MSLIFHFSAKPSKRKYHGKKPGLVGDQFCSERCHFSTTITQFNQLIHHNDKVKPKKLSRFTLNKISLGFGLTNTNLGKNSAK